MGELSLLSSGLHILHPEWGTFCLYSMDLLFQACDVLHKSDWKLEEYMSLANVQIRSQILSFHENLTSR